MRVVQNYNYYYRSITGQTYTVTVVKKWWRFALVKYSVHVIGFVSEYSIVRTKWKPTWRMYR